VFRTWQVFAFSLVPLALVLAGVVLGSVHFSDGDSQREVFPTQEPSASQGGPAPTPPPGASVLQITAENLQFSPRSLRATAGQPVQVQLNNRDSGVQHNIAFYNNSSASQVIFKGELFAGPQTKTESFTAPSSRGNYYFRCDVHPDMNGSFVVQ
jgi:plastocyanin